MSNEIRHMYEKEYKLGQWALKAVERQMKIKLPSSEAGNIALHFINARQNTTVSQKKSEMERFIDDITDIVESELNIIVDHEPLARVFDREIQMITECKDKGWLDGKTQIDPVDVFKEDKTMSEG